MTVSVVVPVKGQWHHTAALLNSLRNQDCRVLVIDNGSDDCTPTCLRSVQRGNHLWRGRLRYTLQPDLSIYEMWNLGYQRAEHDRILITNNDIVLTDHACDAMVTALAITHAAVAYPDYEAEWHEPPYALSTRVTTGVLSDGGMFGACFMLARERIPWRPLITDLAYEWWYGDNHLAECIATAGRTQVRVVGLPVQHVNEGTASTLHQGELYGMKYRDRQRWITRHERNT